MEVTGQGDLKVIGGVVRKRALRVTLEGATDGAPRTIRTALFRDDAEIHAVTARWPADFRFSDEAHPRRGKLSVPVDEALGPVAEARLNIDGVEADLGPGWSLTHLYASSEHQFVKYFFRAKARMLDRETQMFAARQLVERYKKNIAHRCVAAVLYAYCAMDIGDADEGRLAYEALDLMLRKTHRLETTDNGRTDRLHLTLSMLCAALAVDPVSRRRGGVREPPG